MTNCQKCFLPRDEPPGNRRCKKCGRPESVSKRDWERQEVVTLEDLFGPSIDAPSDPLGQGEPAVVEAAAESVESASATYGRSPAGETLASQQAFNDLSMEACAAASTVLVEDLHPELADPVARPAHSKLGGSSAKRWINCPGSVNLIARLPEAPEDSEYAAEGTQAHELAAQCLRNDLDAWEALATYPLLSFKDVGAIQQYLDYVRSLRGWREVEVRFHRPELHPHFYGTIDADVYNPLEQPQYSASVVSKPVLEIIDFKFGQGIYVPVEHNEQLLYYAAGHLAYDFDFWPDHSIVRLTIVQPRLEWGGEPIRSWDTTVGEIKQWLYDVCLPAMVHQRLNKFKFVMGDWCQFCPAKLYCPEQQEALEAVGERAVSAKKLQAENGVNVPALLTDYELGCAYELSERVKGYQKAVRDEVQRRMMNRASIPGVKLVAGKADRVWKDNVDLPALFGSHDAWQPPKLISPAMAEKLPNGKAIVAEWAYKPEVPPRIALASDPGAAVELPVASQVFSHIDVDSLG